MDKVKTVVLVMGIVLAGFNAYGEERYKAGELLVKFKPSASAQAVKSFHQRVGSSRLKKIRLIDVELVKLPWHMTVEEGLAVYKDNPDVEYAEPNYFCYTAATTPEDTYFANLWGLDNTGQSVNGTFGTADADIDAPEAWDITTGSSNVIIAVVDTGVDYNHPDLTDNIWANSDEVVDGVDTDGNGKIDDVRGWDFVHRDNDPIDSEDHGTHVAGTIAAHGNNEVGISGVCWTAKIMPLRFLNAFGSGNIADAASAFSYAIENGAKIINASYVNTIFSQTEYDAISSANSAGVLFVAAAGNYGTDNDITPIYPASYDLANIIAVAATDQDDVRCSFSNYGATTVDVAAPGKNIYSPQPARQTVWSDNFDDNDISDWTTGGTNNTWALSSSISYSVSYSLTDSPGVGVEYQHDTVSWARAPVLDLSSYSGAKLEFKLRGISESDTDFLYVQTSINTSIWTDQDILIGSDIYNPMSGSTSDSWFTAYVDLGAYDSESTVYIRFYFTSDSSTTYDGWYIDNLTVTAASSSYAGNEYQYMAGTSMATPHVSGLAGLILTQIPTLTHTEVKAQILAGVDTKSALSGKVVTGGRVNAFNSLDTVPPADTTDLSVTISSTSGVVTLGWIAAGDDSTTGTATSYIVKYSQSAITSGNWSSATDVDGEPTPSVGGSTETLDVSGLSEGQTYYFALKTIDDATNSSGLSNVSSCEADWTAPATVTSLTASAGNTQITLVWTDPVNSDLSKILIVRNTTNSFTAPGNTTTYTDGTSSGPGGDWCVNVNKTTQTYINTDLTNGITYYYTVYAYDEVPNYSTAVSVLKVPVAASSGGGGGGGGCFIATAAYGTPMADDVQALCRFRDNCLLTNRAGRVFVKTYYELSPSLAALLERREGLKLAVRVLLKPVVKMAELIIDN